ncbi:SDR family NAD(P)-dependent oxidoreductase [Paracoccus benzoatiresistens]|uniref:SDR family NAD(P)-dependent oxidoreductase n=1 Tax=Paracoccus benzoatiresistens TaxID=2997341 RepID=A0ABT4J177_9RHOB|nr:SDR family NAD(P)-dependent oxidoreductase [Paracoccus sp. EF6]MCZ0960870.1 SDR family NAD(P)-dependent oxidoreductase [Paracoccus sp. EF6]
MELKDSRAIVTGGASGLGAATAAWFRSQGARVVVLDREASDDPDHVQADVTSADSATAAIAQAVGLMGGIDICVNCAGIVIGEKTVGRKGAHDLDAFCRVIEVNLIGSFNVLRLAAVEMARNGRAENGVIVNTASVAAFDGQKGQAAYAASKAGIAGMTLPLARDLAGLNIRVCAIAPGIFATPMLRSLPPEVQDGLAAEVTFPPRLGDPREFARLAAHIVENGYLNGEVIRLDGALRMG